MQGQAPALVRSVAHAAIADHRDVAIWHTSALQRVTNVKYALSSSIFVDSAYLTLVACRRVEAGPAGPAGGAAFAVWNVLRLQAYACLCTPFRVHLLGCQRQVRSLFLSQ